MWPVCDERGDGFVFEILAIMQVDFKNVAAVPGESDDCPVG